MSISKAPKIEVPDEAVEVLGYPGKMLSGNKQARPGLEVVWNACVFREDGTQVWWGDFNLTTDRDDLQSLAIRLGTTIYLTPEQPFRFEGLDRKDPRVVKFTP